MHGYYLDTSAIVKRYLQEQGTEVMDRLLDGTAPDNRFYTSWLSILELTSAILRLANGGQLTLADVVLPAAQWAEEEGTMTNLEGRVIRRRRAFDPPRASAPTWLSFASWPGPWGGKIVSPSPTPRRSSMS